MNQIPSESPGSELPSGSYLWKNRISLALNKQRFDLGSSDPLREQMSISWWFHEGLMLSLKCDVHITFEGYYTPEIQRIDTKHGHI